MGQFGRPFKKCQTVGKLCLLLQFIEYLCSQILVAYLLEFLKYSYYVLNNMMKWPFVFLSENGLYFSNIACRFQTNYKQNSAKFIMEFAPFFDVQKGTFSFSATVYWQGTN